MKLYELTGKYAVLMKVVDEAEGEITEEVESQLREIEDSVQNKVHNCLMAIRNMEADADALKREEDRLSARRKAQENKQKRLRKYIIECLQYAKISKVKTDLFNVRLNPPKDRVEIDDVEAIPDRYVVIERKPKKKDLAVALKNGKVPGARIGKGDPSITVT